MFVIIVDDGAWGLSIYYKGAGTFHSASQSKEGSVGFGTSQHPIFMKKTFTRSSLALNMSRKLLLDPYLAIHGKIMAKNGHFFMEF